MPEPHTGPGGVRATGGEEAGPADLERITDAILAGKITVHGKIGSRCDHGPRTAASAAALSHPTSLAAAKR